jgi:hypothetical protein
MAKTASARKRSMSGFIGATGGLPDVPANTTPPEITGTAQVGETLTVTPGVWTGREAPTLTYQWRVAAAAVVGATGTTFAAREVDEGEVVTVTETAMNWAGVASVTSAATDAVAAAD